MDYEQNEAKRAPFRDQAGQRPAIHVGRLAAHLHLLAAAHPHRQLGGSFRALSGQFGGSTRTDHMRLYTTGPFQGPP